uniref:hypothetical protein n=1 Tax=Diaporthe caulivora TaxID=60444 RepID=UPI002410C4E7|nr:hypothetical protein P8516_mgp25 [Diaporthe caulivora]WEH01729.1 hypothetical protein [Diaporthe caulivora]
MNSVPAQKCSNHNKYNQSLTFFLFPVYNYIKVRAYSTSSPKDAKNSNIDQFIPAAIYEDAFAMKKQILKDNAGKVGIYMFTNKLTGDIYVGQSIDLRKRFLNYFNLSYLSRRNELIISRAIIKYGYSNFSVTILEYCDKCDLDVREQHYFDTLNPQYNIQKVAGGRAQAPPRGGWTIFNFIKNGSKGLILSEETKNKISQALKGVYIGDKAYWYGRSMSAATKEIMSSTRKGELNPLYGKSHSEASKELMRQKAGVPLGRKYSEETKLLMSSKRGNPVNIYEKCTSEGFELIGSFVSARKAGKFLGISGSTILSYMKSKKVFKDRYKFSSK